MDLPVGYHQFHRNPFFNYQLNRWHGEGFTNPDELKAAAQHIRDRSDYHRQMMNLAEVANRSRRSKAGAFYLRAAEFFLPPEAELKLKAYRLFREHFDRAFADAGIRAHAVPYAGAFLNAWEMPARGTGQKGTLLIHGGFDSFIEEFFCYWQHFADRGFRVLAFDGPGQGGTLREYGLRFDHNWEKPVGAILDHFAVEKAALLGISMGGYWCLRAAAFEPRIRQVIAQPPVYDWLEQLRWAVLRKAIRGMMQWRGFMNASIRLRMRLFPLLDYGVGQVLDITGREEPVDAAAWLLEMNPDHLQCERIDQDVLLIGGARDRFQPVRLLRQQEAALTNAASITTRVFTAEESADQHCQMGNLGLALQVMGDWLENTHRI